MVASDEGSARSGQRKNAVLGGGGEYCSTYCTVSKFVIYSDLGNFFVQMKKNQ